MKIKNKKVLRTSIFITIVLVVFIFLNSLFQPIWYSWGSIQSAKGFYEEPENSIETVFLGTSIGVTGIIPNELYDEYGICSYNLSTVRQPIMASYYWMEEAYRLHPETLKTVMFDVSALRSEKALGESYYHKAFDYMRMSDVKFRAIKEYANGDITKLIEFILPIAAYHDRWNDLRTEDLKYYVDDLTNGQRGYFFTGNFYQTEDVSRIQVVSPILDENAEPAEDEFVGSGVEYVNRMAEFCEEHDIKLVLTKLPTVRWDSELHNAVQNIADKNGLDFVDYNFSPLYDKINYVSPFDCFDDNHMNYYGAHKVTKLIGEYLVEECDATDVRGLEEYKHMEAQSAEFDARRKQSIALKSTETVDEYLNLAISDDNTVFITVKDSAAHALTDAQRKVFSEIGLNKLADIDTHDSYVAVIGQGGKIILEELNKKGKGEPLSCSGTLDDNTRYEVESGGYHDGNTAYCKIDKDNYAVDTRGMNIVVYNHVIDEVIDSTAFDTHAFESRDTYSISKAVEVAKLSDNADINLNSITGQVRLYMDREQAFIEGEELRMSNDIVDLAIFLDTYINNKDNLIIIAGGQNAKDSIMHDNNATIRSFGLHKYEHLKQGEPYIAMIDGGSIEKEMLGNNNDVITIEELGLYAKSEGMKSGGTCSIKINNHDYVKDVHGLNVVVYNRAKHCVIDSIAF